MIFENILLAACPANTSSPVCLFAAPTQVWFPIVLLGALTLICVIAVIYIMAPLLGRNDIKIWARAKVYDAIVTVALAVIFLTFATPIFAINPTGPMNNVGLVPAQCTAKSVPSTPNLNINGMAVCDISVFNQDVYSFSTGMFWLSVLLGVSPTANFEFGLPGLTPQGSIVTISFPVVLFPIVIVHQYIVPYMQVLFTAVLASQVQQLLLGVSMLIFSVFMILGLIARSFGITKSFGGGMIAFALGLGLIYPLMVSITYGFIDVSINNAQCHSGIFLFNPYCSSTFHGQATDLVSYFSSVAWSLAQTLFTGAQLTATTQAIFTPIVLYTGFIGIGLTLIPLLNLVIVDAFIVDFSRTVGERMDLLSILTRIL